MKTLKLTQLTIARACGVTQCAVSGWFSGISKPSINHIKTMEAKFNIPPQAWYDIRAYILDNSERFGAIKILREQHNGSTKV